ncbi:MAG: TlpA disulfide reductase family protein [Bacteroidales bacterium]|nr:TlpA disulfide reductase family protein [Bacteroidales bacterium]
MRKIFFSFIIFSIIIGCNNNKKEETFFTIKGELTNVKNGQIITLVELTPDTTLTVDSVTINNGAFLFKRNTKEIGFYILQLDKKNSITLLIDTTDNIFIKADGKKLRQTYEIIGSKGSELIHSLEVRMQKSLKSIDSLRDIFNAKQNEKDFYKIKLSLDSTWYVIFNEHQAFIKNFINKNMNSLACMLAISEELGRTRLMTPQKDYDYFIKIDSTLCGIYPKNGHVKVYHERISEIKRIKTEELMKEDKLAVGAFAPDIKLPDTKGKMISLSSLKGKFVLIDFWASWCRPCVNEIPNLVKIYKKYHKKGFEIYGVSLDGKKFLWEDAIKVLKINWVQVSDLDAWNSAVAKQYDVKAIPMTYLLDMEGKIIAKGLVGEELEKKLEEIFKPAN